MTLTETLDRADSANRELWQIVFSEPFPGDIVTHKTIVLIGFIDIALEHNGAITLLDNAELTGKAPRPFLEWATDCSAEFRA